MEKPYEVFEEIPGNGTAVRESFLLRLGSVQKMEKVVALNTPGFSYTKSRQIAPADQLIDGILMYA